MATAKQIAACRKARAAKAKMAKSSTRTRKRRGLHGAEDAKTSVRIVRDDISRIIKLTKDHALDNESLAYNLDKWKSDLDRALFSF